MAPPMSVRDSAVERKMAPRAIQAGALDWLGYFGCSLGRTRTLDSHASRLRRKLNLNGEATYVVNVWGVGYRLVAAA
jgi:DNA-binding response OmpR family regulator